MIPVAKLHHELKLSLDKVDSLNSPNLLPNEIDALLWRGIKSWFTDLSAQYEHNKVITDKLSSFHVIKEEIIPTNPSTGVYAIDLSELENKYFTITKVEVLIQNSLCEKTCTAYSIKDNNIDTQYNNSSFDWCRVPYKIGYGNASNPTFLYLYADNFQINSVKLSYLREPEEPFIGGYTSLNGKYTLSSPAVNSDINEIYLNEIINQTLQEIK